MPPAPAKVDLRSACFDSYCPGLALAKIPVTPGTQAGSTAFMAGFAQQLTGKNGIWTTIQKDFDAEIVAHDSTWPYDPYNQIAGMQQWDGARLSVHVAATCNEAFTAFEQAEKLAGHAVPDPSTLDWKTLPNCKAAGAWLEKGYVSWFQFQVMDHFKQPALGGQVPNAWDPFGIWKLKGNFTPALTWWQGGSTFYPMARYAQLFDKDFLTIARPHIMAALCGLEVGTSMTGTWDFKAPSVATPTSQWLLRVNSWAQMTTALLRTEKLLGIPASPTDCAAGTYSSADALATTETLAINTQLAADTGGEQPEYHSAYGNFIFEQLAQLMTTPSSQKVYDAAAAVYRDEMWDIAANFAPATGTMAGPSGRNYDLFLGSQNAWEAYTFPLYIQPFFHPYCDTLGTCGKTTLDVQTPQVSAEPTTRVFDTLFAMWQLGGFGTFAYRDDVALFETGYRTNVQRAGFTIGKDRQHFVSPYYSMGNAGDDDNLTTDNYTLSARLGGPPNPAYPLTPVRGGKDTSHTFTVGEVRTMLTAGDNPFDASSGVPGEGAQLTPRQVVAQYQSLMLVTQLAVPGPSGGGKYGNFTSPLSSNLLLPLAVDEIDVDSTPLPRTNGAATALPADGLVTLRLGNASIVIRTLTMERSATTSLLDVSKPTPVGVVAPGSAKHQYGVEWQVDDAGYALGYGKVVFTHKAASDLVNRPYHVAWLWAGGLTRTEKELAALQQTVRDAVVTSSFATTGKWDYTSNMFDGSYAGTDPTGADTWTIVAAIAGHALRVRRQDVYLPWNNSSAFGQYNGTFPYYTLFERTWDGAPTMPEDWTNTSAYVTQNHAVKGSDANLTIPYSADQFFQPHLSTP